MTWVADLRAGWAYILDHRRPFTIHIVHPKPPQFRDNRAGCHIILEQAPDDHHAALILTALLEGYTNDGIIQGAFSVCIDLPSFMRAMEMAHFCTGRQCVIVLGQGVIQDDTWVDVSSGDSLCPHPTTYATGA